MNPIIPTVFALDKEEFQQRLKKVLPISNNLQIDFMDGKFVKEKSIALKDLPKLLYPNKNFEAHLMVKDPYTWIPKLEEKGFSKIIFHKESLKKDEDIENLLNLLKQKNLLAYLAVNPKTPIESTFPFLSRVKGILVMGVVPGKEHQSLEPGVLEKIKLLRSVNKAVKIQVDGGVNDKTAALLIKAGANYLNSGSFISEAKKPKDAYNKLVSVVKKAR